MTVQTIEDFPHGELRGYRGSKTRPPCHCDRCRAANTAHQNRYDGAYRAKLRAQREPTVDDEGVERMVHPDPPGGHGSITAFLAAGCQCGPCRDTGNGRRTFNRHTKRSRERQAERAASGVDG